MNRKTLLIALLVVVLLAAFVAGTGIIVWRADNTESRVITRKTGMLRRADIDLETRARQHAEQNIRQESLRKGILTMAQQNGEKKMADFLHTLGFERVRFNETRAPLLLR